MPGFVDTHIHYPQTEMTGAFGEQLLQWLEHYVFPVESQYRGPAHADRMWSFFLHQLLSNGTTTALFFGTVHSQLVEALFSTAEKQGMRLIAGKVMMDRNAPDDLIEMPEESYQQTHEFIERRHNRGHLVCTAPRFAPTCSGALLEKVCQLKNAFPGI
ncbi:guanine deaminase [Erwinia tracheiphila PSU-1]|nr:guanine deaminase [Erwinia tracheiphila PSU-1]